jgi:GNAT superfamily N-acetyltransferase
VSDFALRPYRAGEDLPARVALFNQDRPEYRRLDVEDARWDDGDAPSGGDRLRLAATGADGSVVGYAAVERGGLYNLDLVVGRAHRGRGIGAALLGAAQAHARAARIPSLRAWFYRDAGEESPAARFYVRHGFAEREVRQTAYLDLAGFDPAAFVPAAGPGVRPVAYHRLPDGPAERARLHRLLVGLGTLSADADFDAWAQANLGAGGAWSDCLYVAEVETGDWVGLSVAA